MDALSICCCAFWRQVFSGIVDICKIAIKCKFIVIISVSVLTLISFLANTTGDRAVIILDIFKVLSTRHEIFGMPMLARPHEGTTYIVVPSTVCLCCWSVYFITTSKQYLQGIGFLYNVQHDCPLAKCTASGNQDRKSVV